MYYIRIYFTEAQHLARCLQNLAFEFDQSPDLDQIKSVLLAHFIKKSTPFTIDVGEEAHDVEAIIQAEDVIDCRHVSRSHAKLGIGIKSVRKIRLILKTSVDESSLTIGRWIDDNPDLIFHWQDITEEAEKLNSVTGSLTSPWKTKLQ